MDRWIMYPVAFVTTVQPYLLGWVLAIAFFITLAVVAALSRGRSWRQIVSWFVLVFLGVGVVATLAVTYVVDIHVIEVEVVRVPYPSRD